LFESEAERIKAEKFKKLQEKMQHQSEVRKLKISVNDNSFQKEVIEKSNTVPVVVDFWAEWCMPCLMLGPTLDKLAEEYSGKFILAKLNVDENPVTSQEYAISSIHAVKLFKNGKVADKFVGALPEPSVRQWLAKHLD